MLTKLHLQEQLRWGFYGDLNSGRRNYEMTEVQDKTEAQEFWGSI